MFRSRKFLLTAVAAALLATPALAERGADGQLNILYWQAPSIQNPDLSGGTKDIESSSLVLEPLAYYDENGNMVPALAAAIPTVENGGVSADLTSITWKLKPGVVWSDGTALTSADVVFSGEYCMHPEGGCNAATNFTDVTSIESVDDLTVKITFGVAKPFPYGPFVGTTAPIIQKAQFENCTGAKAPECTEQNFGPIGTGPFTVTEFRANDVVVYAATIEVTSVKFEVALQPPSGFMQYSPENTTSVAVSGVPSDQITPGFSFQVIEVKSAATPPFSTVGISAASAGTI